MGHGQPRASGWGHHTVTTFVREVLLRGTVFPLLRLIAPVTVRGRANLRGLRGPVIVASNHVSHLDTPTVLMVVPASVRRRLAVAAAADYFYRSRLRGAAVSLLFGAIPFERGEESDRSLARCEALLEEGRSLLLFPEGTRSQTGELGRVRSGVAVLATRTGTPVVPVYVHGMADLLPKGRRAPLPGALVADVGAPLSPGSTESVPEFRDRVAAALESLARRRPPWGEGIAQ